MKDAFAELIGYMLRCACVVIAFVLLPGCAPTIADISLPPPQAPTCSIPRLPPVPKDVKLDIFMDKIDANAGGELLLRGYVACRSAAAPAK